MNLGRQIHTLLKRQPAIYVNRLGVFKRVHTAATFDVKRQVYLPPITFIEFDSNATEGYDFVTYVQQAGQLERAEAELQVEQAVSLVLERLTQSGQASLDNLGDLVSYGNSYVFKPVDLTGFSYTAVSEDFQVDTVVDREVVAVEEIPSLPESEVPITQPLDEPEVVAEVSEVNNVREPVLKSETSELADQDAVLPDAEFEFPAERKSTSAYVYVIVAIVALLLVGGLYYYSTYMQGHDNVDAMKEEVIVPMDSIPMDTVATLPLVDSLKTEQDTVALAPVQERVEEEAAPPADHRYTIVIGTHRTLALAYEEAEAFHKDGHKSVRVITPNLAKNLKRVVWDTYASKEERDSALHYVKKHIKTDAWPDVIR